MKGGFGCSPCCAPQVGCTSRTISGYDAYIDTSTRALATRIGAFSSSLTLTSVTIPTAGLSYPLSVPPAANTQPVLQIWAHDSTNNLPRVYSSGGSSVLDILTTLTAPASFQSGDWVFTHAGYTLSANTFYWIVLRHNGEWAYWVENCAGASAECIAACCDYWTQGTFGGGQSLWDGSSYCGAYAYTLN